MSPIRGVQWHDDEDYVFGYKVQFDEPSINIINFITRGLHS